MLRRVARALFCAQVFFIVLSWTVAPGPLFAHKASEVCTHPMSTVWCQGTIESGYLSLRLEVVAEDLAWYESLETDADDHYSTAALRTAAEVHGSRVARAIEVHRTSGKRVPAELVSLSVPDWPVKGVPAVELQKHSVHYELRFDIGTHSEFLTFYQDLGGAAATANHGEFPVFLELNLQRDGQSIATTTLEGGHPITVYLGTGDRPPRGLNHVTSDLVLRADQWEQEVVVPVALLARWIKVDQTSADVLSPAQSQRLLEEVGAIVTDGSGIWRQDDRFVAKLVRVVLVGPHHRRATSSSPAPFGRRCARVALTLRYSLPPPSAPGSEPNTDRFEWRLWSAALTRVYSTHPPTPQASDDARTKLTRARPILQLARERRSGRPKHSANAQAEF